MDFESYGKYVHAGRSHVLELRTHYKRDWLVIAFVATFDLLSEPTLRYEG
jgi:hypothetical protein